MTKQSETDDSIKLRCQNCGHVWNYRGSADYYASCPNCNYKVNVKKRRVDKGEYKEDEG